MPDDSTTVDVLVAGYADLPSVGSTVSLVRDGDQRIIVDPGMVRDRRLILDPLEALGVRPADVTTVFVSHHHLDHLVNVALFPNAELVDLRTVRRDDQVHPHQGEGHPVGPRSRVWLTPGHTPDDATLVVDAADGRYAFTHLWWRTDRTPAVDPYAPDPDVLERSRRRVLEGVDIVVPGHGAPFRVR